MISATELINWIGYAFRVMDEIAEWNRIYKIKTIGDAYFAIAGLPNALCSTNDDGDNNDKDDKDKCKDEEKDDVHPSMRMLMFASYCAQIFSTLYSHPEAGSCLEAVAAKNVLFMEKQNARRSTKGSHATSHSHSTQSSGTSTSSTGTNPLNSQCAMRYGLASGPVTTGVLHGKCPAFDVWGATVNLASRMEVYIHVSIYLSFYSLDPFYRGICFIGFCLFVIV